MKTHIKKTMMLLLICTVTLNCKEQAKSETDVNKEDTKTLVAEPGKTLKQSDGLIALHGNFLYSKEQNAAVLQTPTKMYGIVIDDKMHELNTQVKQYTALDTDMVPVTIRGRIFKKEPDAEGWEDIIEIKEILKVTKPNPEENEVIKVGSK